MTLGSRRGVGDKSNTDGTVQIGEHSLDSATFWPRDAGGPAALAAATHELVILRLLVRLTLSCVGSQTGIHSSAKWQAY